MAPPSASVTAAGWVDDDPAGRMIAAGEAVAGLIDLEHGRLARAVSGGTAVRASWTVGSNGSPASA